MTPETTKIIALWAVGGDTGISSKFLAACALGQPDAGERWIGHNTPSDRDDFGRCYRLSLLLTEEEFDKALELAAERSEGWKAIRENWVLLHTKYGATLSPCETEGCYHGMLSQTKECPGPVHSRSREFYQLMKKLGL